IPLNSPVLVKSWAELEGCDKLVPGALLFGSSQPRKLRVQDGNGGRGRFLRYYPAVDFLRSLRRLRGCGSTVIAAAFAAASSAAASRARRFCLRDRRTSLDLPPLVRGFEFFKLRHKAAWP